MSNSFLFSRIFTLQSSSWFCFIFIDCFLGVLEKSLQREWEIYFITIGFENFQNFNFSVFPFLKFIDFKIPTNSFIYSLVEQFLETHFHKNNYRGSGGILLGKTWQKFQVYIPPYLGCGGILYEQQLSKSIINDLIKTMHKIKNSKKTEVILLK